MNKGEFLEYITDRIGTLEQVIIDFIIINENFKKNDDNQYFIKNNLKILDSSFHEFGFIDDILQENLAINILNIVCYNTFKNRKSSFKTKVNTLDYDILKISKNIERNQKLLGKKGFNYIQIEKLYDSIDLEILTELKNYRDKHYSHIDKNRKQEDTLILRDVIKIIDILIQIYQIQYKFITNLNIKDKVNVNTFELKLKTFKYDMIMKYIKFDVNPNIKTIKIVENCESFEDVFKLLNPNN